MAVGEGKEHAQLPYGIPVVNERHAWESNAITGNGGRAVIHPSACGTAAGSAKFHEVAKKLREEPLRRHRVTGIDYTRANDGHDAPSFVRLIPCRIVGAVWVALRYIKGKHVKVKPNGKL